jgi:predicted O-methyltransferase YrrM
MVSKPKDNEWNWLLTNEHLINLTNILEKIGERIEGNLVCDIEPRNWTLDVMGNKIKNLQYLCKNKKKIMEIGVNGCHSLLLMLLVNPEAEYLLFDLNCHKYTIPALEYIRHSFPNTKITVKFGNSVDTIREYILNNQKETSTFDLIHLDGGHTENIFSEDYKNSKTLIKKDGIIIFDDYMMPAIKQFIGNKLKKEEIIEVKDPKLIKDEPYLHFVYQYH